MKPPPPSDWEMDDPCYTSLIMAMNWKEMPFLLCSTTCSGSPLSHRWPHHSRPQDSFTLGPLGLSCLFSWPMSAAVFASHDCPSHHSLSSMSSSSTYLERTFSRKASRKYRPCGLCGLWGNFSALPLQHACCQWQQVNQWEWWSSDKTLFIKTGSGRDLVHELWFAVLC